jgi:RNA polymerase sigma factor (sigma-70 family)
LAALRSRPAADSAESKTADLYEQYGQDIYRFCSRRLRSHEEAEDAVQNTFLRVYGALRKGIVPEFETAWLYKIAHNVCLSRIAGKSRASEFETLHDGEFLESVGSTRSSSADELFGLDEALARMPDNLRLAILLREWQGLSYAEIAGILGVSQSAVETLIFRARRHLAEALEGGVTKPARRALAGLNLGPAIAALRGWIVGAPGAAKLAAAGALALGLAGGGLIVEQAIVAPAASISAPAASHGVPVVASSGAAGPTAARAGTQGLAQTILSGRSGTGAAATTSPASDAGAAPIQPTVAGPPAVRTSGATPASAPTLPHRMSTTKKHAEQPTPSVRVPKVPSTGIQTVPVPSATPSLPIPTVPSPSVDVPTVPVPSGTPTVGVPTISTPSAPGGNVPAPTPTVGVPTS